MKPSESEYIRIDLLDFFILDEFKGVRPTPTARRGNQKPGANGNHQRYALTVDQTHQTVNMGIT